MSIRPKTTNSWRRFVGVLRRVIFICGAIILFIKDTLVEDVRDGVVHGKLFIGLISFLVGVFSFASDRYCDGTATAYHTCTRPATYYYYPWWAVFLIVIGSLFVVLWFLRRKHR